MAIPDTDLPHPLLPSAARAWLPGRSKAAVLPFALTVKPDTRPLARKGREEKGLCSFLFGFHLKPSGLLYLG